MSENPFTIHAKPVPDDHSLFKSPALKRTFQFNHTSSEKMTKVPQSGRKFGNILNENFFEPALRFATDCKERNSIISSKHRPEPSDHFRLNEDESPLPLRATEYQPTQEVIIEFVD
jgi:hypothetical protein